MREVILSNGFLNSRFLFCLSIASTPRSPADVSHKSPSLGSDGAERTPRDSSKRLHHPDHTSVSKSTGSRTSTEMWIPLSATPEPMERAKTRVLVRSTDGVEVPSISSSDSDRGTQLLQLRLCLYLLLTQLLTNITY